MTIIKFPGRGKRSRKAVAVNDTSDRAQVKKLCDDYLKYDETNPEHADTLLMKITSLCYSKPEEDDER